MEVLGLFLSTKDILFYSLGSYFSIYFDCWSLFDLVHSAVISYSLPFPRLLSSLRDLRSIYPVWRLMSCKLKSYLLANPWVRYALAIISLEEALICWKISALLDLKLKLTNLSRWQACTEFLFDLEPYLMLLARLN